MKHGNVPEPQGTDLGQENGVEHKNWIQTKNSNLKTKEVENSEFSEVTHTSTNYTNNYQKETKVGDLYTEIDKTISKPQYQ